MVMFPYLVKKNLAWNVKLQKKQKIKQMYQYVLHMV